VPGQSCRPLFWSCAARRFSCKSLMGRPSEPVVVASDLLRQRRAICTATALQADSRNSERRCVVFCIKQSTRTAGTISEYGIAQHHHRDAWSR